ASGEAHALMGPNGSGKSTLAHTLMGRPGYDVLDGSVSLDGDELLGLPTWERAAKGLFLAMQYPVEVPGVRVVDLLCAAVRGRGAAGVGGGRRAAAQAGAGGSARRAAGARARGVEARDGGARGSVPRAALCAGLAGRAPEVPCARARPHGGGRVLPPRRGDDR